MDILSFRFSIYIPAICNDDDDDDAFMLYAAQNRPVQMKRSYIPRNKSINRLCVITPMSTLYFLSELACLVYLIKRCQEPPLASYHRRSRCHSTELSHPQHSWFFFLNKQGHLGELDKNPSLPAKRTSMLSSQAQDARLV